jgi:hypothetical protein
MPSSGILRYVALVRIVVSEERSVTRIGELETMLAVTSNHSTLRRNTANFSLLAESCHHDDGSNTILRNVGSYKRYTL